MTETFYDQDTMTYKTRARYGFGWTDCRAVLHPGEVVLPAPTNGVVCEYCRSVHTVSSCPNCGAPR